MLYEVITNEYGTFHCPGRVVGFPAACGREEMNGKTDHYKNEKGFLFHVELLLIQYMELKISIPLKFSNDFPNLIP